MTSGSIVLAAAVVLVGSIILRGINPVTAAIEAIVWSLYRITAITAALAKTSDIAYLRLRWEYRTAVNDLATQRAAMLKAEEQRLAPPAERAEMQSLRLVPSQISIDDLSPASGVRQGA
jgi:hypothetical protein